MTLALLTAVTDARWEADLIADLDRGETGVAVVRRCVDLADLLAVAATGTARAAVVSADLRGLDRDALARLAVAGVAVVVLAADEEAERRARQMGVAQVLPVESAPADIVAAVVAAVASEAAGGRHDYADVRFGVESVPPEAADLGGGGTAAGSADGRVVAVWGPTGAPGRTTVAVGVAGELAELGVPTLLVDADVYGGVVAQVLGLLDESPGLAAATRLATSGALDVPTLTGLARSVRPGLAVLTGISRPDRWPELRPSAVEAVLALARRLAAVVVVDCGFGLEQDEELAYDTAAPRRNGATLAALADADEVVAVGSADPVGLQRLVRGLTDLHTAVPTADPIVVVNRVRRGPVGPGDPQREVAAALSRYAGVQAPRFVPLDVTGCDAALAAGRTLAEAAPASPARAALRTLAADLAGRPLPRQRRRLRVARRRPPAAAPAAPPPAVESPR